MVSNKNNKSNDETKKPVKKAKASSVSKSKSPSKSSKAKVAKDVSVSKNSSSKTIAPSAKKVDPPRLKVKFENEVLPALFKEFDYKSVMQVPRLEKIVVNIGLGEALVNGKAVENASRDLSLITGQKPIVNNARKSIAAFKLREGQAVGVSVTLRGRRMYEFFDRLISSSLPRIRDFRGLSRKSLDGSGNYSLGIREQSIFPEIDYNSIDKIRGLQVVITTTAKSNNEGLRLLESLGMPLIRDTRNKSNN
ncbi:MAG: 50S ribosomal protein L5 [SAR202 cluster bacterium]|nr:50S ribosomal protein L5 [SAR202 cluster bacterium]|tara:strand:- start:18233 stop:18982 length:750 start_codon:yes stop_codon:yes gene_type:complete